MDDHNVPPITTQQILAGSTKSLGDALSDPFFDLLGGILDEIADLAKKSLRARDGLPPEEPTVFSPQPLSKKSVFRKARTAEELGLTEDMAKPWKFETDEKA